MNCSHCGHAAEEWFRVCPACGAHQDPVPRANDYVPPMDSFTPPSADEAPALVIPLEEAAAPAEPAVAPLPAEGLPELAPRPTVAAKPAISQAQTVAVTPLISNRLPFEDSRIHLWAYPLALALSLPFLPGDILRWYVSNAAHEFGHTLAAWFGGRFSISFIIFAVNFAYTWQGVSQLVVAGGFLLALGLGYYAWRRQNFWLLGAVVLLELLHLYATFTIDEIWMEKYFLIMGFGGQFLLSTLMVVAFYYPLPDVCRWDWFRYPVLYMGMNSFVYTYIEWKRFASDPDLSPVLREYVARPDSDTARLMNGPSALTAGDINTIFLDLGLFCMMVMLGHYLFFLWKCRRR